MSALRRALRAGLPLAVSAGILLLLLSRIDLGAVLSHVDSGTLATLGAALVAYWVVSLGLEALTLARLVPTLSPWVAARVKAASYPMALAHYGLGAATLAYLLQRHSSLGVAAAAGTVLLIAVLDLGLLLAVAVAGAVLLGTEAPELRIALAVALLGALGLGLAFVRGGIPLPWLERLRQRDLFLAVRDAPTGRLLAIGALRLLFVLSFVGLCATALFAFEVRVPPGDLVVNVTLVTLVGALPIAVAGIGTTQAAFVYLFREWASAEVMLACSLTLSAGIILLRATLGLVFAREFTREAWRAAREGDASG